MAKQVGKLSALTVQRTTKEGLFSDGGGLYLRVKANGGKFWVYRFTLNGKAHEMGLGALHTVSLAEARQKATDCRKLQNEGINPIKSRDDRQEKQKLEEAKVKTFRECAEGYIAAHKAGWRNAKHSWQWDNTLTRFVYPVFGDFPVQAIDVALVIKVLEPLWQTKTETASRLRGRIELILDWATAREYRKGENPARWRGHLQNLLPKPSKIQKVQHQPALPYEQIGGFMELLKNEEGIAALAMQFTILTASRTSETLGASWKEMDLPKKLWTVPASRIKAGREHRVPLSEAALQVLRKVKHLQELQGIKGDIIFFGQKAGKSLSNTAMLMLLRRMNYHAITVHGFRSSFRDWAAEQTNFPREVAEAALAHISGDKVELAYRRSDLFEKRKQMMDAWARYVETPLKQQASHKIIKLHH